MQRVLDVMLGHSEMTLYNKKELTTMIMIQHEQGHHQSFKDEEEGVNQEEVSIITGALKFRDSM